MKIFELFESKEKKEKLSYYKFIVQLAMIDGQIDNNELSLMTHIADNLGLKLTQNDLDRIVNRPDSIETIYPDTSEKKHKLLSELLLLMLVDNVVDNKELQFCQNIAKRIGLNNSTLIDILNQISEGVPDIKTRNNVSKAIGELQNLTKSEFKSDDTFQFQVNKVSMFVDGKVGYSLNEKLLIKCTDLQFNITSISTDVSSIIQPSFKLDKISELADRKIIYCIPTNPKISTKVPSNIKINSTNKKEGSSVFNLYKSTLGVTCREKSFALNEPWLCNVFYDKKGQISKLSFVYYSENNNILIEFEQ